MSHQAVINALFCQLGVTFALLRCAFCHYCLFRNKYPYASWPIQHKPTRSKEICCYIVVRSCLLMRVSHVGKHYMTTRDGCHYARADSFQLVPFVCSTPLSVQIFHQKAPLLGQAIRFGEADHPGPSNKNTCLLNVVVANPTSVANKQETFEKLIQQENVQILCLAETSATKDVQKTCQRSLIPLQLKSFWSQPVPPQRTCLNEENSIRGRAGGCAIISATGMRYCRNPMPPDWQSTTRALHTVANFGNSHFQIVTIYSLPQSHP